jgi:hypothetical protein
VKIVPKKPKLITCSRCHRSIPAEEYSNHLLSHKGKKVLNLPIDETSFLPRLQQTTMFPSKQEAFNAYTSSKPIKSALSYNGISEKFKKSLKDVNGTYLSLKILQVEDATLSEVDMDEKRNLILRYNPLFIRTLTEQDIDALLLHEACHVATLPDTNIRVPNMDAKMVQFLGNSITNYDEYIAHVYFIKKFRNDPRYEGLKEQHIDFFNNYDIIIQTIKANPERFGTDQFCTLEQLAGIVYDSLFFFVANDDSFLNWSEKHNLENLALFIKWIYEDFEYVRMLNLPFEKTHDKILSSGVLSMSVNPLAIFFNKIEFAPETKRLHQDWAQKKNSDLGLIELWEKRRELHER